MFHATSNPEMRCRAGLLRCLALAAILQSVGCAVAPRADDPRAAGISYSLGGTASREFAAPLARVKAATTGAFAHYGLRIDALGILPNGESLRGRGARGTVLVELERLGRARTLLRVTAQGRDGVDRALEADLIIDIVENLEPAGKP